MSRHLFNRTGPCAFRGLSLRCQCTIFFVHEPCEHFHTLYHHLHKIIIYFVAFCGKSPELATHSKSTWDGQIGWEEKSSVPPLAWPSPIESLCSRNDYQDSAPTFCSSSDLRSISAFLVNSKRVMSNQTGRK